MQNAGREMESTSVLDSNENNVVETTVVSDGGGEETTDNKLNQYVIDGKLGSGAYATVHLAHLEGHPEQKYAIKVVKKAVKRMLAPPGKKQPQSGLKIYFFDIYTFCFLLNNLKIETNKEVALMKKMKHKHLVRLFEVIDDPKKKKLYLGLNGSFFLTRKT